MVGQSNELVSLPYLTRVATFIPESLVPYHMRRWLRKGYWRYGYHKDYERIKGWFDPNFPVKDLVLLEDERWPYYRRA